MTPEIQLKRLLQVLVAGFVVLRFAGSPDLRAQTIWNGPTTAFTQSSSTPTDVLIPGKVSLTRGGRQWLYNPAAGDTTPGPSTPTDTEWAFGSLSQATTLTYQSFSSFRNGDLSAVLTSGGPMVCHLINENIYLQVTFTEWTQGGGPFAYTRTTPAAVAPSVSITNPPNNSVFSAPANIKTTANATVSSGTVTNVSFRTNGSIFAKASAAPFSTIVSNVPAGSYSLTAVAIAGGVSTTSSVVNVTVVASSPASVSSQAVAGNQFTFNYSANPGLSYVVQNSSDLVNWVSLITNVASSNVVHFSDAFVTNGSRYYRVGLLPNP